MYANPPSGTRAPEVPLLPHATPPLPAESQSGASEFAADPGQAHRGACRPRGSSTEIILQLIAADPGRAHRGLSHREIADETGLSVGRVKYALRRLRESGEVVVTSRWEGDFHWPEGGELYGSWYRSGNGYEVAR